MTWRPVDRCGHPGYKQANRQVRNMEQIGFSVGNLVLYRSQPARVKAIGRRIQVELPTGETVLVRPKDLVLLHPGPIHDLSELRPTTADVRTTWELLAGKRVNMRQLAELAFGEYTPAASLEAWQWVADGLYFHGTPDSLVGRTPAKVAETEAGRVARALEAQHWTAFVERVRSGRVEPQDGPYLDQLASVALGTKAASRILRALGRSERPENAHALLLELGHWDYTVNPHPQRLEMPTAAPTVPLPPLPNEHRVDLTHLAAFAIDDKGNQDPDDAVSLEPNGNILWVHVADAAALIVPGSPADREAQAHGATLYLPEGTVPMLPRHAVESLGLGLNDRSPALSFRLDVSLDGEIRDVEPVPSWVRVQRMTYSEVSDLLDQEPFSRLRRLARAHWVQRQERGAISISLPEVKVAVVGGMVQVQPIPLLPSREMISELMQLTGSAIARLAAEHGLPFPYATQPPPHRLDAHPGLAGMYAMRRSLPPSQYSTVPAVHHGLGLQLYAQVTSPLRRYLDLVAHQQIRSLLRGEPWLDYQEIMERIGSTEAMAGSVRQAERLSRLHWTLVYLLQNPGWHGEGVVVERNDDRGRLLIPDLDLETTVQARPDWSLNSTIPLALRAVDLAHLEASFAY